MTGKRNAAYDRLRAVRCRDRVACMRWNKVCSTDVCRHGLPPGAQPCYGAFITGACLGMRGYRGYMHGQHIAIHVHTARPMLGKQECRT